MSLKTNGHANGELTTLVDELLAEQRTLTAVERFSQHHDRAGHSAKEKLYSALMPARSPNPGEQYAFQVDLDACTGCKACVSACHTLNGLDENEIWRTVGLLHGGTRAAAILMRAAACISRIVAQMPQDHIQDARIDRGCGGTVEIYRFRSLFAWKFHSKRLLLSHTHATIPVSA